MLVRGADDVIHLTYTGNDGTAWYRRLNPDGSLTARERVSGGLGADSEEVGSILPLVYLPESNTVSVIYRLDEGRLRERRSVDHGPLTPAVTVTDRAAVQNAVDSDQTGADAIADGETVHLLFIDAATRQLYHTYREPGGEWSSPTRQTEGENAQWVRGSRLVHDGSLVYGYVFDAGSDGGSGKNRYAEIALDESAGDLPGQYSAWVRGCRGQGRSGNASRRARRVTGSPAASSPSSSISPSGSISSDAMRASATSRAIHSTRREMAAGRMPHGASMPYSSSSSSPCPVSMLQVSSECQSG